MMKPFSQKLLYSVLAASAVAVSIVVLVLFRQNSTSELGQENAQQVPAAAGSGEIVAGSFDEASFKTDAEWRKILSSTEFKILRHSGTEIPYTGELLDEKRAGTYYSVGCDKPLFSSDHKYDSKTGWPSFWQPIDESNVVLRRESAPGDNRIEVLDTCGNHLGHVFEDGPEPTGLRYCMNSAALRFVPDNEPIDLE